MSHGRREPKLVLEFVWLVKNGDLASGAVIITSPCVFNSCGQAFFILPGRQSVSESVFSEK